jgi:hypothetical protein
LKSRRTKQKGTTCKGIILLFKLSLESDGEDFTGENP